MISIFSCSYWPSVYLLWRNVYLVLLPIFLSGLFVLMLLSITCCCCSVTKSCLTLCNSMTTACHASLSISVSWSLLKLMSIESAILSTHLILCHPLFLLPSIFPSSRVFSNESVVCTRWPKHWRFSFSISPGVVIRIKGLNTYKAVSMFPDTGNRVSINFTEIVSSSVGLGFKMD